MAQYNIGTAQVEYNKVDLYPPTDPQKMNGAAGGAKRSGIFFCYRRQKMVRPRRQENDLKYWPSKYIAPPHQPLNYFGSKNGCAFLGRCYCDGPGIYAPHKGENINDPNISSEKICCVK